MFKLFEEGSVNRIEVIGAGVSYRIGDIPRFDNTQDTVSSVVNELSGKFVQSIQEESLGYVKEQVRIIRKDKNYHPYLSLSHSTIISIRTTSSLLA